jgi:hypothetical protein
MRWQHRAMEFADTPAERFERLSNDAFEPHLVKVDPLAMRMQYVDEGPRDAPIALMPHGEPSGSYLYRFMIPPCADAGLRGIAPDLIGFGKSSKPTAIGDYSYARHVEWMTRFPGAARPPSPLRARRPFLRSAARRGRHRDQPRSARCGVAASRRSRTMTATAGASPHQATTPARSVMAISRCLGCAVFVVAATCRRARMSRRAASSSSATEPGCARETSSSMAARGCFAGSSTRR